MLPRTSRRIFRKCTSFRFISNLGKANSTSRNTDNILTFDELPEPKSHPVLGTALDYTFIRGFNIHRLSEFFLRRHDQCGDIYKEKMPGFDYWVFCRSKEDNERLFRMEGRTPYRMYLKEITTIKDMMGYPESVGNEMGENWLRLRLPLNKLMLKKNVVWKYSNVQRDVCKDAVRYIQRHRDDKFEVPGMADFFQAWAFEIASTFMLNCRVGMLEDNPSTEVKMAFRGTTKMMEYVGTSFVRGPWGYKARIGLKRGILQAQSVMKSIVEKQKNAGNWDGTFLHDFMKVEKLSQKEKESLLMDIVLAAVDTTANAASLCLYCLATSKRVQDKLRREIMALSAEQRSSGRAIDDMIYMNAFFKEAHRLLPFVHGLPRSFDHDVVLSGYTIPAGTRIINTINSTSNKNPEYFENPDECIPERWLDKSTSRFLTTGPFGIGARGCPGRFFAKQEIFLFLIEILSNFEVQYHYKPATSIMRATGVLSEEPKFSFVSI